MNFIKNPTVIIVLLGLIVGSSLYFYNSYETKKKTADAAKTETAQTVATTPAITDLTNADPSDYTAEIKKELDLANSKALAYNSSETLAAIEITIPGKLVPRSGNTTYIYDSSSDLSNHYTVSISQATQAFVRAIVPKEDYYGTITAINQKSWKLSYIDALKAAEKNGGKDFRNSNSLDQVQLVLKNTDPKGWLYWVVTYKGENSSLSVQLDAYTGKFITPAEIDSSKAATTNTTSPSTTNTTTDTSQSSTTVQ
jgi:uncharacterized protein YpmB